MNAHKYTYHEGGKVESRVLCLWRFYTRQKFLTLRSNQTKSLSESKEESKNQNNKKAIGQRTINMMDD